MNISSLPILPSGSSCYITDSCTNVHCCAKVPALQKSFDFSLSLHGCAQYLQVQLEEFQQKFMFGDLTFGQEAYLWIKGAFRLTYVLIISAYRFSCYTYRNECVSVVDIMLTDVFKSDYKIHNKT